MKRTKLMGLESEFENFCIQEGELIQNMYSRLMHILNEFDEVGESLFNSKIVDKIFRAIMRRSRCKSMISILEAMQDTLDDRLNYECRRLQLISNDVFKIVAFTKLFQYLEKSLYFFRK
jgi:hypothetical protein